MKENTEKRIYTDEDYKEFEMRFYSKFGSTPEEVDAIKAENPEAIHAFITRNYDYLRHIVYRYIYIHGLGEYTRTRANDYISQLYLDLPLIIVADTFAFIRFLRGFWLRWVDDGGYRYRKENKLNIRLSPKEAIIQAYSYDSLDNDDSVAQDWYLPPDNDTPETFYIAKYETRTPLTSAQIVKLLHGLLPRKEMDFLQLYLDCANYARFKDELNIVSPDAFKKRVFQKLTIKYQEVVKRLQSVSCNLLDEFKDVVPIEYETAMQKDEERRKKAVARARVWALANKDKRRMYTTEWARKKRAENARARA